MAAPEQPLDSPELDDPVQRAIQAHLAWQEARDALGGLGCEQLFAGSLQLRQEWDDTRSVDLAQLPYKERFQRSELREAILAVRGVVDGVIKRKAPRP